MSIKKYLILYITYLALFNSQLISKQLSFTIYKALINTFLTLFLESVSEFYINEFLSMMHIHVGSITVH